MQAYENKGAEVYTNGSAGHTNGTELSRMKEVEFEKIPSEPMVYYLPLRTHFNILIFVLPIPPRWRWSLSAGSHSEAEQQTKVHCGQNIARRHDPQTR